MARVLGLVLVLVLAGAGPARAATAVDVELVLAVDVSRSMDLSEQRLQREGYVAAIQHPEVLQAIRSGFDGRVAITYVEWAGPGSQTIIAPWTLVEDEATASTFAETIAGAPFRAVLDTSISEVLVFAAGLFEGNGYSGHRQVIDVSGDGPNNIGRPVEPMRDAVLEQGIVINGLPIMLRPGGYSPWTIEDLDFYYADCVIGGPGSFVLPVKDLGELTEAIRQKLVLEIAGTRPRVVPAAAWDGDGAQGLALETIQMFDPDRPPSDCLIGEKRRRMWMR